MALNEETLLDHTVLITAPSACISIYCWQDISLFYTDNITLAIHWGCLHHMI